MEPTDEVRSVAWSADGQALAAAGDDGAINVWDADPATPREGLLELVQHYAAHSGAVCALAFHPTRAFLLSAGADAAVRVWDLREGSQLFTDNSGWLPAIRGVKVPDAIKAYETPRDCYTFGMPYVMIGSSVLSQVARNMHQLVGPQGSVDKFVAAMEAVMPEAARTDLRKEINNRYIAVRPQDPQVVALHELFRRTPRNPELAVARERLESSQTQTEALLFQMQRQLTAAGE